MKFLRFIAVLTACLLTSCIDCHEEVWLESNGSGRADITYTLPSMAARFHGGANGVKRMIANFLATTKEIKSSTCEVSSENDRLKIHVTGSFDSVRDFKKISAESTILKLPSSATGLAGKVDVNSHGREVSFSRTISPGVALSGSGFMPASTFAGHRLVYIIHLPVVPEKSNATRLADGGRTLVWDFPLGIAIQKPVTTRFKVKIPIPPWFFIAGSSIAVSIAGVIVAVVKKFRKSQELAK